MLQEKLNYNINKLVDFAPLVPKYFYTKIAVAVSGGVDSVALLILLYNWAQKQKIEITALTVNHNLRPQSGSEVEYVEKLSENLGIKCRVFSWNHANNFTNLQERARDGRYALMTEYCQQNGIFHLAIAHTKDDYTENFRIRTERKSSIFGLSSSNINFINNIKIIRPLFDIPKHELIDYLTSNSIGWFEDQSNSSDKYHRNRVRKFLNQQGQEFKQQIMKEQEKINTEVLPLSRLLVEAIAESVSFNKLAYAEINPSKVKKYPDEIKFQLLNFVLTIVSGHNKPPRGRSASLLANLLPSNELSKTLHGCHIKSRNNKLMVYREFGKVKPDNVNFADNAVWDNRFRLQSIIDLPHAYVTNLSMKDYRELKKKLGNQNLGKLITDNDTQRILFTLPVIKRLEKLIALPHISYYDNEETAGKFTFTFNPPFISRFTHFLT